MDVLMVVLATVKMAVCLLVYMAVMVVLAVVVIVVLVVRDAVPVALEAVRDVKLHAEASVHQAAETNVVVVEIVVMADVEHHVPILVQIIVLTGAIPARLDAQEDVRFGVMVVQDHVETAVVEDAVIRVHPVVLDVRAVVEAA